MKHFNKDFFMKMKGRLKIVKDKAIKKVMLVSLSASLIFSGCAVKQESENAVVNTSNSYTEVKKRPAYAPLDKTSLTPEMIATLEKNISISDIDYQTFMDSIHRISVKYENSEYFEVENALKKYEEMQEYDTNSSKYIKDGRLDESVLRKRILENNENYLSSTSNGKYCLLDSSLFNKVFSSLVDGINTQLEQDMDIGQMDEKLDQLKVLRTTYFGSGMVTEDLVLAVNLEVIETRQKDYPSVDYLRMTVLHESNHLAQMCSEKEKQEEGYSKNIGIAYSWDELNINPLFYTWYTEGAAEHFMLHQYQNSATATSYENNVKAIESLTLATILRDDVDEISLSALSLQSDLSKLFAIFNCQNEEDKKEVINMMYAFDICLNQSVDFTSYYKKVTGNTLNMYHYQDCLKASIAQTLTKRFYENLSQKVFTHGISLQDTFFMIGVFEQEMNRLTKYSNDYYYETNKEFMEMYNRVQHSFFSLLAKSLNSSEIDIYDLYNAYYHDNLSNTNTTSILQDGEVSFMNHLLESRSSNKLGALNEFKVK